VTTYKVWGRANSANVIKVIWALLEAELNFERIDAGLDFGVIETPKFRHKNPNGLVPVLEHGSFVIWESNSIIRYIARSALRARGLYPADAKGASNVDQWLDWQQSRVYPLMGLLFLYLVRQKRDRSDQEVADLLLQCEAVTKIMDEHLARHNFIAGCMITLADIALAPFLRRHLILVGEHQSRNDSSNILRWMRSLSSRPTFLQAIAADALPHPDWLLRENS